MKLFKFFFLVGSIFLVSQIHTMHSVYAKAVICNEYRKENNSYLTAQLGLAIANNNEENVQKWLKLGAGVNTLDANGDTPLHAALNLSNFDLVPFLIEQGACPNAKDVFGMTPLHVAAHQLNKKSVHALVQAGAEALIGDCEGKTPLHLAVHEGLEQTGETSIEDARRIIKMLIAADKKKLLLYRTDLEGKSVLDYAQEHPKHPITKLLLLKKAQDNASALENNNNND